MEKPNLKTRKCSCGHDHKKGSCYASKDGDGGSEICGCPKYEPVIPIAEVLKAIDDEINQRNIDKKIMEKNNDELGKSVCELSISVLVGLKRKLGI